jgi:hypothetical protein
MLNSYQLSSIEPEWDKRGYYKLYGKKYYSKLQAIVDAKDGHHPEFIFNDQEFSAADWSVEPRESLQEIYRQRALQLRTKYDHLVLCYSSGADSTNILHAFLYNNIPIDEIFCYGPFDTTQGQQMVPNSNSAEFNYREIDLVALPYLRELSKIYKFKVTFYSWAEVMVTGYKNADWVWTEVNARLSPSMIARNRLHDGYNHLNLTDKGKKVGFIFGVDKPRVILKNGSYYMAFLDLILQQSLGLGGVATGSDWDHDEFFYWTPDMPKLLIKQAHVIKNFFEKNPALKAYVQDADQGKWSELYSEKYLDVVKSLVYPTWNNKIWQTNKNRSLTFAENDSWFFKNSDDDAKKNWLAGVNEIAKVVDSSWFNQGNVANGFIGSWSKWYKIG